MEFAFSILKEYPKWDSLAVMKLTAFPYEKEGFKPFSQARICFVQNEGMYARLWAFDVDPITACPPHALYEGNALFYNCPPAVTPAPLTWRLLQTPRGILPSQPCRGKPLCSKARQKALL